MKIDPEIQPAQGFLGDGFEIGVQIVAFAALLIERRAPRTKLDRQNDHIPGKHGIHELFFPVAYAAVITQQDGKSDRIVLWHIDRNVGQSFGTGMDNRLVGIDDFCPEPRDFTSMHCAVHARCCHQRQSEHNKENASFRHLRMNSSGLPLMRVVASRRARGVSRPPGQTM